MDQFKQKGRKKETKTFTHQTPKIGWKMLFPMIDEDKLFLSKQKNER